MDETKVRTNRKRTAVKTAAGAPEEGETEERRGKVLTLAAPEEPLDITPLQALARPEEAAAEAAEASAMAALAGGAEGEAEGEGEDEHEHEHRREKKHRAAKQAHKRKHHRGKKTEEESSDEGEDSGEGEGDSSDEESGEESRRRHKKKRDKAAEMKLKIEDYHRIFPETLGPAPTNLDEMPKALLKRKLEEAKLRLTHDSGSLFHTAFFSSIGALEMLTQGTPIKLNGLGMRLRSDPAALQALKEIAVEHQSYMSPEYRLAMSVAMAALACHAANTLALSSEVQKKYDDL